MLCVGGSALNTIFRKTVLRYIWYERDKLNECFMCSFLSSTFYATLWVGNTFKSNRQYRDSSVEACTKQRCTSQVLWCWGRCTRLKYNWLISWQCFLGIFPNSAQFKSMFALSLIKLNGRRIRKFFDVEHSGIMCRIWELTLWK